MDNMSNRGWKEYSSTLDKLYKPTGLNIFDIVEACSVVGCFYNSDGQCNNCDDMHNPELEEECMSYLEDDEE